jgi:hypothetical protein
VPPTLPATPIHPRACCPLTLSQVDDLRLVRPWPALAAFAASFDLAALDDAHHKHVPYGAALGQRHVVGGRVGCMRELEAFLCQGRLASAVPRRACRSTCVAALHYIRLCQQQVQSPVDRG